MMSTGAMGMSAMVAIAVIVLIALGSSQSFAAPQTLSGNGIQFTRCDNSKEPIGKIEISACKDQKEFCIFKYASAVSAEFEFTPAAVGLYACDAKGAKCPFEAGVKQHLETEFPIVNVEQRGDKVKLFMADDFYSSAPYFWCVEMPGKLVR